MKDKYIKRKQGSCRFSPYYKLEWFDSKLCVWKPRQVRYKTLEEAVPGATQESWSLEYAIPAERLFALRPRLDAAFIDYLEEYMFDDLAPNPDPLQTWIDMPEFDQQDASPKFEVVVRFMCWEHVEQFSQLIDQTITPKTKSLLFPKDGREKPSAFIWRNTDHES